MVFDGSGDLYKILWYGRSVEGQHQRKRDWNGGHEHLTDLLGKLATKKWRRTMGTDPRKLRRQASGRLLCDQHSTLPLGWLLQQLFYLSRFKIWKMACLPMGPRQNLGISMTA